MSEEEHPNNETAKYHNRQDQLREMIGGVLATGLWFFIDLYFLYPENHQAGYWLGLLFISAQFIQNSFFGLRTTAILIVFILGIIGGIGQLFLPSTPPKETETHGWLTPADDPTPTNNPSSHWVGITVPKGSLFLFFGPIVYWVGPDEVVKHHVLITIRNKPVISFDKDGDKISISGDIWNEDGSSIIADIQQNEFHLVYGQYGWAKRSDSDRSTLTVIGHKGEELLYIRFANPTTIRLRGVFPIPGVPDAAPIVITDSAIENGGMAFGGICTHSNAHTGTMNFGS